MPRTKKSSEPKLEHIHYLCSAIESKFGRAILNATDCKDLHEAILNTTSKNINEDTLRELFRLVNRGKNKTIATLNILAEYVGFYSWSALVATYNDEIEHKSDFIVFQSIAADKIDLADVNKALARIGQCKKAFSLIQQLIHIGVLKKDCGFFEQFFDMTTVFDWNDYYRYDIFYTIQLLGVYVQRNGWLQDIAKEHYFNLPTKHPNYSYDYYVELFVDTDHYEEYYGELLENYYHAKKSLRKVEVFRELIVADNCIKNGAEITNLQTLQKLNIQISTDHNILAGRWYGIATAIGILIDGGTPSENDIMAVKSKIEDQGHLITFLYHAVRNIYRVATNTLSIDSEVSKAIYAFGMDLIDQTMPSRELLLSHWGDNNLNQLNLYRAALLHECGNMKEGDIVLLSIHPKYFDRFSNSELTSLYQYEMKRCDVATAEWNMPWKG
jgi:hypothetical protein